MPLPNNLLPTNEDVIEYYSLKKGSGKTIESISNELAKELIGIWKGTAIPTLEEKNVKNRIKNLIMRNRGNKKSRKSMKRASCQGFLNTPKDVCIISKCRCFIRAKTKNEITNENCNCKIEDKIPSEKMTFFKNNLFRNYNDESTNEEEENPAKRLKLQSDTTIEVQGARKFKKRSVPKKYS